MKAASHLAFAWVEFADGLLGSLGVLGSEEGAAGGGFLREGSSDFASSPNFIILVYY